jgi:hypothetical protein
MGGSNSVVEKKNLFRDYLTDKNCKKFDTFRCTENNTGTNCSIDSKNNGELILWKDEKSEILEKNNEMVENIYNEKFIKRIFIKILDTHFNKMSDINTIFTDGPFRKKINSYMGISVDRSSGDMDYRVKSNNTKFPRNIKIKSIQNFSTNFYHKMEDTLTCLRIDSCEKIFNKSKIPVINMLIMNEVFNDLWKCFKNTNYKCDIYLDTEVGKFTYNKHNIQFLLDGNGIKIMKIYDIYNKCTFIITPGNTVWYIKDSLPSSECDKSNVLNKSTIIKMMKIKNIENIDPVKETQKAKIMIQGGGKPKKNSCKKPKKNSCKKTKKNSCKKPKKNSCKKTKKNSCKKTKKNSCKKTKKNSTKKCA